MGDRVGKAALKVAVRYLRRRYRRETRIGLVLLVLAALAGLYLASRDVPEG